MWRARALRQLGWPGALAVALFAASLAFYFSAIVPARDKANELFNAAEYARATQQRVSKNKQRIEQKTPAAQLAAFNAFFPPLSEAPKWVAAVYAAARGERLTLERGDYKVLRETGVSLVRYQITLPVKGSYPQIRQFIAEVLEEAPLASIDDVSIRRDKIGQNSVEARIKISLYMKDSSNEPVASGT